MGGYYGTPSQPRGVNGPIRADVPAQVPSSGVPKVLLIVPTGQPAVAEQVRISKATVMRSSRAMPTYRRVAALRGSFAAGPGIPPIVDRFANRSGRNYAHLLADRLGAQLTDLTVSAATTRSNCLVARRPSVDPLTGLELGRTLPVGPSGRLRLLSRCGSATAAKRRRRGSSGSPPRSTRGRSHSCGAGGRVGRSARAGRSIGRFQPRNRPW